MGYVEWLRVRGCLKWVAIVLAVLLLVCVVVRVALMGKHDYVGWVYGLESDPGAKVTQTSLPDGTRRTTIDDPVKSVRVVIDDRGSVGKHIQIYDYSTRASSEMRHGSLILRSGNINVSKLPSGHGTLTVIDTNDEGETDFVNYIVVGMIVALLCATVLGAPFAREGDGHLEVALTKPVSRHAYAATAFTIDVAGIAVALCMGIVFCIAVESLFVLPRVVFAWRDVAAFAVGILGPIAWYAMLTAATASMRRNYGAVLGFAWPVAGIVLGLALVDPNGNALLSVVHGIAWVLSFFDPLTYTTLSGSSVHAGAPPIFRMGYGRQAFALLGLALFYGFLSLVQWRRIEA